MKWEKNRNLGKQKYVLRYGVIYIGMSLTILFTLVDLIANGTASVTYLVGRLLMFPTVGSILASQRFDKMDKKYNKYKKGL
ncbi:hypothetical protein [Cohnella sp. WQ 127256]|uniref:hypothetical protein n=1 Tax=Cohnella sp. WQ 127256 TaxID=2938790 RepID=UPI002118A47A|nr:hypothetical protein [Cohnella sp. WQ 127256]